MMMMMTTEVSASCCCHEEWSPQQHKGSVQAKIIDLGTGLFSCWEIHCLQRKRCRHSQQQEATDRKIPLPRKGHWEQGHSPKVSEDQALRGERTWKPVWRKAVYTHVWGQSACGFTVCGVECLPVLPTHLTLVCPGALSHNQGAAQMSWEICKVADSLTKADAQEKEEGSEGQAGFASSVLDMASSGRVKAPLSLDR